MPDQAHGADKPERSASVRGNQTRASRQAGCVTSPARGRPLDAVELERLQAGAMLPLVNGIQKRGSYVPRRVRERRAYQLAVGGGVAGLVGVVGLLLAVVGVIGATLPIVALVVAAICAYLFRRVAAG
jgi:hypothetical protein